MKERDSKIKTEDIQIIVLKLNKIKKISLELLEVENPNIQNNMENVLSQVNELLYLFDYEVDER